MIIRNNFFENCGKAITASGDGTGFIAGIDNNVITNCATGVRTSRIISSVNLNTMTGVNVGINTEANISLATSLSGNTITATDKGVYSVYCKTGDITGNTVNINGSVNSSYGLEMYLSDNIDIKINTINATNAAANMYLNYSNDNDVQENDVNIASPGLAVRGLYSDNSHGNLLKCNDIVAPTGSGNTESFGIWHQSSNGTRLECNSFAELDEGIKHLGQMFDVQHRSNQYGNGNRGLVMGHEFATNAYIGDQEWPGDNFFGSFSGWQAFHHGQGSQLIVQNSEFFTDSGDEGQGENFFLEDGVENNVTSGSFSWFNDFAGNTKRCIGANACSGSGSGTGLVNQTELTDLIIDIVNDSLPLNPKEKWVGINNIYKIIATHIPPANWNPTVTTFMNDFDGEEEGILAEVEILIEEATALDQSIAGLCDDAITAFDTYSTDPLANDPTLTDYYLDQITTSSTSNAATESSLLGQATTLLNSFTATSSVAADYKQAYTELIDYLDDPSGYNGNTVSLTKLAKVCPTNSPKSVSIAKGLLATKGVVLNSDWSNCQTSTPRSKTTELSTSLLYPNPTTGIVNIPLGSTNVQVYDQMGKLFFSSQVGVSAVDLSVYPSGTYIIRFTDKKDAVKVEQVISIR